MISLGTLFLFIFAVIGMTHIIVGPAAILQPFRDWAEKHLPEKINDLLSCYQCCGTWCGFIMGAILISYNPFVVFACGMAGSWLSTWSVWYINWLEANSIVDLGDEDTEEEEKDER